MNLEKIEKEIRWSIAHVARESEQNKTVVANCQKRINKIFEHYKESVPAETLVSQPSEPSFGQWIDFKEKPPEKDGEYIIYVGVLAMDGKPYITIRKGHSFEFEHRAGKTKQFSFEGIFDTHKVIKWMPLPKP